MPARAVSVLTVKELLKECVLGKKYASVISLQTYARMHFFLYVCIKHGFPEAHRGLS